jgi:hypothetical protein
MLSAKKCPTARLTEKDWRQLTGKKTRLLISAEKSPALPTKAICKDWVKYKYKVLSSLLRLVTVDKYVFKSQPLQIAKG